MEAGLVSDWVEDNRARALLALGRTDEALALLQALSVCGTDAVAAAAREQLATLGDVVPAPATAATPAPIDLTPVLEDAIRLRESGKAEASLQVLDAAVAAGLCSGWIEDNRARALVQLERRAEALVIWEALAQGDDEGLQAMAEEMAARQRQALALTPLQEDVLAPSELAPELKVLLDEAIALRESGQVEASLAMLDRCSSEGNRSPWLAGNRARALLALGRIDEALAIWHALVGSSHKAVSGSAKAMLERLEAESQRSNLVEELNGDLRQLLQNEGRVVQHLPESAPAQLMELELPLLKEAIGLREANDVALSLQVLEAAVAAGLRSGWIDDNRARALVNLERYSEAVELWQALLTSDTPALQDSAKEMLELNEARGLEQGVLLEVDRLLEQADSSEQGSAAALEFLTDALLQNPDRDALQEKLQSVASALESSADAEATFAELKPQRQVLKGFDVFLSVLEQRYATASAVDAE